MNTYSTKSLKLSLGESGETDTWLQNILKTIMEKGNLTHLVCERTIILKQILDKEVGKL
jgi:hypothetical protein